MLFLQPTNKTAVFLVSALFSAQDESETKPPALFLGLACCGLHGLALGLSLGLAYDVVVGEVVVNHVVDDVPVEAPSDVAVVNIDVGVDFPSVVAVLVGVCPQCLIDGAELYTALAAPFHCLIEQSSLPDGPEHELVPIGHEFAKSFCGMGYLLPYFRVSVLYDSPVEID